MNQIELSDLVQLIGRQKKAVLGAFLSILMIGVCYVIIEEKVYQTYFILVADVPSNNFFGDLPEANQFIQCDISKTKRAEIDPFLLFIHELNNMTVYEEFFRQKHGENDENLIRSMARGFYSKNIFIADRTNSRISISLRGGAPDDLVKDLNAVINIAKNLTRLKIKEDYRRLRVAAILNFENCLETLNSHLKKRVMLEEPSKVHGRGNNYNEFAVKYITAEIVKLEIILEGFKKSQVDPSVFELFKIEKNSTNPEKIWPKTFAVLIVATSLGLFFALCVGMLMEYYKAPHRKQNRK